MRLTVEVAEGLAELPIGGICREYPSKLDHVINGPSDLRTPRDLHPAFYGCFDWHSSVHSHWMLIHVLKRFNLPNSDRIRGLIRQNLTSGNLLAEAAYLSEKNRQSFERPYGWTWLLKLALELYGWDDEDGKQWSKSLHPLETAIVARYFEFLPRQRYPVRTGTHSNTAFGLTFAHDYAVIMKETRLQALIEDRAIAYFASDSGYAVSQEPSGADFLSPCLTEADLLRRVLPGPEFRDWLHRLLPDIAVSGAEPFMKPVEVSDRSDPQIGHLDGLNLSRAWCMAGIASSLPVDDPFRDVLNDAAQHHAVKGISHVSTGNYMGEHWLATFAIYMLSVFESYDAARVE